MATVPPSAKKPTDRKKPKTAAERRKAEESAEQYAPLTRNGHTFRVLHPADWYLSTSDALNNGNFGVWAREAIHPDDFEEFDAANLRLRDMRPLMEEVREYFGADLGE